MEKLCTSLAKPLDLKPATHRHRGWTSSIRDEPSGCTSSGWPTPRHRAGSPWRPRGNASDGATPDAPPRRGWEDKGPRESSGKREALLFARSIVRPPASGSSYAAHKGSPALGSADPSGPSAPGGRPRTWAGNSDRGIVFAPCLSGCQWMRARSGTRWMTKRPWSSVWARLSFLDPHPLRVIALLIQRRDDRLTGQGLAADPERPLDAAPRLDRQACALGQYCRMASLHGIPWSCIAMIRPGGSPAARREPAVGPVKPTFDIRADRFAAR